MKSYLITKVQIKDKAIELMIDDEKLIINEDIYASHYLYINKELSEEEYHLLKEEADLIKIYNYVYNLLRSKPYFSKQIFDKLVLVKKLDKVTANKVIKKLEDEGLLNDLDLAVSYLEEGFNKHKGYNRIRSELTAFNVDINKINYVYDEEVEYSRALSLLDSLVKKYGHYSFNKMKDAIINAYLTLGYSLSIASKIVNTLNRDDFDESDALNQDFIKLTYKLSPNEVKLNKEKITKRLLAKGYAYASIKQLFED